MEIQEIYDRIEEIKLECQDIRARDHLEDLMIEIERSEGYKINKSGDDYMKRLLKEVQTRHLRSLNLC